MNRGGTGAAVALLCAAGLGCGSDDEGARTVTVTRTVVQTVTAPAAVAAPDTTATAPAAGAAEPLPDGVVAIEGTYAMEEREDDYFGENTVVEDGFDSDWIFETTCAGSECTVSLRRELRDGTFKNLTLEPVEGRDGVYEARSAGRTDCATGDDRPDARQRYSIRVNKTEDLAGRPTATVLDAYYSERTTGCELSSPAGGTVSFRGSLRR
jgi:hypothetical protein